MNLGVVVLLMAALLAPVAGRPVGAQTTGGSGLCDEASGLGQFDDVEEGDYAAAYVLCMRVLGLSLGRGDGTYGSDLELTRGQMASFLVRLWRDVLGRECPAGVESPFTDVVAGSTHEANIGCLYGLGITKGVSATAYGPGDALKASQITRFLFRLYSKSVPAADGACPEGGSGSELDLAAACLVGLNVTPTDAEAVSPDAVTRAQMAVYVIGLWNNLTGRGLPPAPPHKPSESDQPQPPRPDQPPATTQRIVYEVSGSGSDVGAWGVWRVDSDGSDQKQLTSNGFDPAWSPDGTRIAYAGFRDAYVREDGTGSGYSSDGVWVMNADGSDQKQLTSNGSDPAWSPDGTRIAYTALDACGPDEVGVLVCREPVWVMNADGTNQKRLTTDNGRDPTWSPDGTRIAYTAREGRDRQVWVVNADGTNQKKVTTYGHGPTWSPDGTRIAYTAGESEPRVWVMNADGTNQKKVTTYGRHLTWSPDGTRIAYCCRWGVLVINADGTNEQQLMTDNGGLYPTWSPDGTRIAYSGIYTDTDGWTGVWVMNADGTNQKQITTEGHRPQWSPVLVSGG